MCNNGYQFHSFCRCGGLEKGRFCCKCCILELPLHLFAVSLWGRPWEQAVLEALLYSPWVPLTRAEVDTLLLGWMDRLRGEMEAFFIHLGMACRLAINNGYPWDMFPVDSPANTQQKMVKNSYFEYMTLYLVHMLIVLHCPPSQWVCHLPKIGTIQGHNACVLSGAVTNTTQFQ